MKTTEQIISIHNAVLDAFEKAHGRYEGQKARYAESFAENPAYTIKYHSERMVELQTTYERLLWVARCIRGAELKDGTMTTSPVQVDAAVTEAIDNLNREVRMLAQSGESSGSFVRAHDSAHILGIVAALETLESINCHNG